MSKTKIAVDKVKQARKILLRDITIEKRCQNKSELNFTDTQRIKFVKSQDDLVEEYWRTFRLSDRVPVFSNWLYPKEKN